jgi:hypothetical protein
MSARPVSVAASVQPPPQPVAQDDVVRQPAQRTEVGGNTVATQLVGKRRPVQGLHLLVGFAVY